MKSALATLVLVLAATSAVAESPLAGAHDTFVSTRTRAEVINDVLTARASGTLVVNGEVDSTPARAASSKTRDQVRSERSNADLQELLKNGYQPA